MRLRVTSEIGKLKSVLVHLPGREIDVMVPPMMTQLLFDDILYGQVAREEHRRFQQIIRDLAARTRLPRRVAAALREKRPAALAEVLVGGIPTEKNGSGELPAFDLYPVPNYFFMRDPQVVL